MSKINVIEIMTEAKSACELAGDICDYSGSTYICDAIQEIADNNTSIYYSDIIKFISENVEAVNDAIAEFGWDGCGSDLYKAGQMAEFLQIERDMYDCLDEIVKCYAADYIRAQYGEEIERETWERIADDLSEIDNNSRLSDIESAVDMWMTEGPEDAEESEEISA